MPINFDMAVWHPYNHISGVIVSTCFIISVLLRICTGTAPEPGKNCAGYEEGKAVL
jgi:hypothetical protein